MLWKLVREGRGPAPRRLPVDAVRLREGVVLVAQGVRELGARAHDVCDHVLLDERDGLAEARGELVVEPAGEDALVVRDVADAEGRTLRRLGQDHPAVVAEVGVIRDVREGGEQVSQADVLAVDAGEQAAVGAGLP